MTKEIVTVEINGKSYDIKCPPEQVDSLLESVKIVNNTLGEHSTHSEKSVIMAAIKIANELIESQKRNKQLQIQNNSTQSQQLEIFVDTINDKIEKSLQRT